MPTVAVVPATTVRVVPAATVPVGRRSRLPATLVAATVVFLVVALVKPWAGPPKPHLLVQGSFTPASEPPPAVAGATPGLEAQCGEPLGWTVFTRESWNGQAVRAWRAVEPARTADGPLDPGVPLIRVGASTAALGYCSPWVGDGRPPGGVSISAWRIVGPDAEHPTAVALGLEPFVAGWPIALGAAFRPDTGRPDAAPAAGTWPLGRYVFALRSSDWERWWAVSVPSPRPA